MDARIAALEGLIGCEVSVVAGKVRVRGELTLLWPHRRSGFQGYGEELNGHSFPSNRGQALCLTSPLEERNGGCSVNSVFRFSDVTGVSVPRSGAVTIRVSAMAGGE